MKSIRKWIKELLREVIREERIVKYQGQVINSNRRPDVHDYYVRGTTWHTKKESYVAEQTMTKWTQLR